MPVPLPGTRYPLQSWQSNCTRRAPGPTITSRVANDRAQRGRAAHERAVPARDEPLCVVAQLRFGWTSAELVNWSYNYRQSNATTAAQIQQKVDSILRVTGATKVDIITHSMGPLSARYYIRNLGGDGKVDALVTLGGANHGTTTANFCFDKSCVEMRPNSTFLNNLNSTDETWGSPRYATWWSDCDEVINPHSSALLAGAVNTQTACLQHSQLHEDAGVYQQVRDMVNTQTLLASAP